MRVTATLSILILLTSSASRGASAWPVTPTGSAISTAFSDQHLPVSIPDGAGGAIIAWADLRSGQYDIYIQRIGPAGQPLWNPAAIALCSASGHQVAPVLCSDGAGGAIVAWEDDRTGAADIRAQRIDANGTPLWTPNGVPVCLAGDDQVEPAILADGVGGAIIAWTDLRKVTESDLHAQRVDGSGSRLWAVNGIAVASNTGDQYGPRLALAGANGAIVTWSDTRAITRQDVYAAHVTLTGTTPWTAGGVRVAMTAGGQTSPSITHDGSGGAVIAWSDLRSGFPDIAAQRLTSAGARAWGDSARLLCTAIGGQQSPRVVRLANGWAVVWEDGRGTSPDLYAQRLDSNGLAQWAAHGRLVAGGPGSQDRPDVMAGAGDEVQLVWQDRRGASLDVYAQRLAADGSELWTPGGHAVCTVSGDQRFPVIASDGAGGAVIVWEDQRSFAPDLYGQRVMANGLLGGPEPIIVSMLDVPGDEGGALRVGFSRSRFEDPALGSAVTSYRVERLDVGVPMVVGSITVEFGEGATILEATVPTLRDAVPGDSARTRVQIVAIAGAMSFVSAPDSGSSLDNIGPQAVLALSAFIDGPITRLAWQRSPSPDAVLHRVHRGTFSAFPADSSTLIAATPDTSLTLAYSIPAFYKVLALDDNGNKGMEAWVRSGTTLDVAPTELSFEFARPSPDPSAGLVLLRFALPEEREVRLELFDASGRRVRVLANGLFGAGPHAIRWDGHEGTGGRSAAGVVFARLTAGSDVRTHRITRLR